MKKNALLVILFVLTLFRTVAQDQHALKSVNLPIRDTVWVFTPQNYVEGSTVQFPMVFLLHGWSGNYKQWNDIADCKRLANRYGCIIVCPDGLYDSWYIDAPAIKQNYTTFFFQELLPYLKSQYFIDTTNIFITGLSMGGHGSLYLFEQHPELFKAAGSLSGVLDLSFCWNEYGINRLLGINEKQTTLLTNFSVIGNIQQLHKAQKEVIVSCGTSDRFFGLNEAFKKTCDALKIPITYITSPGGHDYVYWKSAIDYHFIFFENKMKTSKK